MGSAAAAPWAPPAMSLSQREEGQAPWDIFPGPGGSGELGLAAPGPGTARYSRSQGLHEDEGFADVAGLLLPGAAVFLLLAPHLLQSGSRERWQGRGRAHWSGVGWWAAQAPQGQAELGLGGVKCSTNPSALVMSGGTLEGEKGTWRQGKNRYKNRYKIDIKVTLGSRGMGSIPGCVQHPPPQSQRPWDTAEPAEDKAKGFHAFFIPLEKAEVLKQRKS